MASEPTVVDDQNNPMTTALSPGLEAVFLQAARKDWAARLAGKPFYDWLLELARVADPEDPAAWLCGCVILNEECWFDYFTTGVTPAECWAEECSYGE